MRTVFILMDSLNRAALSCYGGEIPTPNFERLASRGIVFERHFVGSLPCMPARRDIHTGRLCFMHRSWGPLEPFDESLPEVLSRAGVYSHLATDHYHYFEDGGATYHNRYGSYDFIRGQECDAWVGVVEPSQEAITREFHPLQVEMNREGHRLQGLINRERIVEEQDFPLVRTFDAGIRFIDRNHDAENWLLQLEAFDPHEPFQAPERFRENFPTGYEGPILNWPRYQPVENTPEEIAELRANYSALVAFCDEQLGRLLDLFDANDFWSNTAIVLTTDHGFLLSEHNWWGKNQMPFFNEIANIPLIIFHPDHARQGGERMSALTQTTDLMPTLLDMNDAEPPASVTGRSLMPLIRGEVSKLREVAVYGIFAGAVNVTDGRYSYFRYPENMDSIGMFEYTLMPTHNYDRFEPEELRDAELCDPFDFTKGVPVLKIPALPNAKRSPRQGGFADCETQLYDYLSDPSQQTPLQDREVENRLCRSIEAEMILHHAPRELFSRWAISRSPN